LLGQNQTEGIRRRESGFRNFIEEKRIGFGLLSETRKCPPENRAAWLTL